MKKRMMYTLLVISALVVSVLACSPWGLFRSVSDRTGPMQEETEIIDLDGATQAEVNLRMGAGELRVNAGSQELVDARFTYNVPDWRPTIDYSVSSGEGELWIEQPDVNNFRSGSDRYAWALSFNPEIPLAMDIDLGAGESRIDLSQLNITTLDMEGGVGVVDLDLTGDRQRDMDVRIRGGVGEVEVRLPDDIGVDVQASGGLGELDVQGLSRDGNRYVNDAFGDSPITIRVEIEGGIGSISLRVVE